MASAGEKGIGAIETIAIVGAAVVGGGVAAEIISPGTVLNQGNDLADVTKNPNLPKTTRPITEEYTSAINLDLTRVKFRTDAVISENAGLPENIVDPEQLGDVKTKGVSHIDIVNPFIVEGEDVTRDGRGTKWGVTSGIVDGKKMDLFFSISSETIGKGVVVPDGHGQYHPITKSADGKYLVKLSGHGIAAFPQPAPQESKRK